MAYHSPGNGNYGPDRHVGVPVPVPPRQPPLLPPSYRPVASPPQHHPLALASFICGLAGVALCWVSMLLPLAGVVCGGLCVLALIALTVLAAGFSSLPSRP